jgi:hypothetical protein
MPKANKGEHFPGLEMLSELLGMRPPQQSTPSAQRPVELLGKTIRDDDEKDGGGGLSREEEDDGEDVGVAPLTNDGEDGSLGHCTGIKIHSKLF